MAVSINGKSHFSFYLRCGLEGQGEKQAMNEILVTKRSSLRTQILVEQLESEQLYRSLFINHPDAVCTLDLSGHFLAGNSVCETFTGYKKEELLHRRVLSLVVPEDASKSLYHFRKAATGVQQEFETSIFHKYGWRVRLSVKYLPIIVHNRIVGVLGIAKGRNRELQREDEEQFRLIAENSHDIIFKFSMEGEYLYVSPSCALISGFQPAELIGRSLFEFVHPDDAESILQLKDLLLNNSDVQTITNRFRTKSGTYKWYESTVKGIRKQETDAIEEIIVVCRDITERKRAEEELRTREERYRHLVENFPDPVMICQEGKWVYSNEAGLKLLGASSMEELMGRSVIEFIHPDYHEMVQLQFHEAKQGKLSDVTEQKIVRLDGRVIDVEIKESASFYQDAPAMQILIRDITERKKTQEILQNSEKLTLVGQLAAGIAHEIRNPLTALKGFLQLMQTEREKNREYFSIMTSELARIELIVSELLVLAKPHSTFFQRRDLQTLIKHVVTLLETEAIMKNVQILTEVEPDIPPITCDENQLKQAFINFLKNGIEAMPQGGEIVIQAKRESDRVLILFCDQGCGIPKEKIARLGEPFFTTKEAGTGLGLMISNKIIENHQGSIRLTSQVGLGTTVAVTLPIDGET